MNLKLIGENWREKLEGLRYSRKLELALHEKARQETLDWAKEQLGASELDGLRPHETVALAVTDRRGKILGADINMPNDLILDNFGRWLAGIITPPAIVNTTRSISLTDINGSSHSNHYIYYFTDYTYNRDGAAVGGAMKVGSGSSAAARGDYDVTTAFGGSPEDDMFPTATGSYSAGYATVAGAITAGGSGTVNEVGLFMKWVYYTAYDVYVMICHDILGSGIPFSAGNIINVSYSFAI